MTTNPITQLLETGITLAITPGITPAIDTTSAWLTQRWTADGVRSSSFAISATLLSVVRKSVTTSALYSAVNSRRLRFPVTSGLIFGVRHFGATPDNDRLLAL